MIAVVTFVEVGWHMVCATREVGKNHGAVDSTSKECSTVGSGVFFKNRTFAKDCVQEVILSKFCERERVPGDP